MTQNLQPLSIFIPVITGLVCALLGSGLTYLFTIKGKQKDIDNQKYAEINNIISNLLVIWEELTRIDDIFTLKSNRESPVSFLLDYVFIYVSKLNLSNLEIYQELDDSVKNLKKYDPVSFYELEGLGKKLEFIKVNIINPLSKSSSINLADLTTTHLSKTIIGVEEHILNLSKKVDKKVRKLILEKLNRHDVEEMEEIILQEFYCQISNLTPVGTYEEFKVELKSDEAKEAIRQTFAVLDLTNIGDFMKLISDNPSISMEEFQKIIETESQNNNN